MITVATIDNHEVVREGVAARLEREPDIDVVASVARVEDYAAGAPAAVVLLDLWLDDGDSTRAIPGLVAAGSHVLVCTSEQRPVLLRRAVGAGAAGLLLKRDPLDTVIDGIRAASRGEFYCSSSLAHALLTDDDRVVNLSPRQVDVLDGIARGLDHRALAASLGIAESVVRTHLLRIRDKFRDLGIEPGNAHDLTRLAVRQGHLAEPRDGA